MNSYDLDEILYADRNRQIIGGLARTSKHELVDRIHQNTMNFETSFLAACYILTATNNALYERFKDKIERAHGRSSLEDYREYSKERADHIGNELLVTLREKEMYVGLTSEEIAGLAAGSMLDLLYRIDAEEAMDTCGMGGDRGFNGIKTLNASTLSAIVNAALGINVMKHGSYGNTSLIGSTDFIERTGANISFPREQDYQDCLKTGGFVYTDAHESKTIHDISHLIMGETINHIIGPMTTPVSPTTRLNRVLGVNHNVTTESIARAYETLNKRGFQKIGNVCVVAGLEQGFTPTNNGNLSKDAQSKTVLDELSPFGSVISVVQDGTYRGTYFVTPADFGVKIELEDILASPTKEKCYEDNIRALNGTNQKKSNYLAMNSGLVHFTQRYLSSPAAIVDGRLNAEYLQESYSICKSAIQGGAALEKLKEYIHTTGGDFNDPLVDLKKKTNGKKSDDGRQLLHP